MQKDLAKTITTSTTTWVKFIKQYKNTAKEIYFIILYLAINVQFLSNFPHRTLYSILKWKQIQKLNLPLKHVKLYWNVSITKGNSMPIFVSHLVYNYFQILSFGCNSHNLFWRTVNHKNSVIMKTQWVI